MQITSNVLEMRWMGLVPSCSAVGSIGYLMFCLFFFVLAGIRYDLWQLFVMGWGAGGLFGCIPLYNSEWIPLCPPESSDTFVDFDLGNMGKRLLRGICYGVRRVSRLCYTGMRLTIYVLMEEVYLPRSMGKRLNRSHGLCPLLLTLSKLFKWLVL